MILYLRYSEPTSTSRKPSWEQSCRSGPAAVKRAITVMMAATPITGIATTPAFFGVVRFFQQSLIFAWLPIVPSALSVVSASSLPSPPLRGMLLILSDHQFHDILLFEHVTSFSEQVCPRTTSYGR